MTKESLELTRQHVRFMTKAEVAELLHRDEDTITDAEYRDALVNGIDYFDRNAPSVTS